ncbi:MAG TPA: hypothetical protein VGH27_35135 [Streptosporangiaceae bacterium]|jgi:hypothetical protein
MTVADDGQAGPGVPIPRGEYLNRLHQAAVYAVVRGAPLSLSSHMYFLVDYVEAWLRKEGPGSEGEVAEALFGRYPQWTRVLLLRLIGSRRIPRSARRYIVLSPLWISLIIRLPWLTYYSVVYSAWHVARKGVRSVPPLITAVVVVFVTSDAWRILGTGFTVRFWLLAAVFLLAGLIYMLRLNCWSDLDVVPEEVGSLLAGMGRRPWHRLALFLRREEIEPAPVPKPSTGRLMLIYLIYVALSAFSLIVVAFLVAAALIVVGVILISAQETKNLAQSVDVLRTLPGHAVITRQLLSLAFSLGAFSAFFLVAAQRPEDRNAYMKNVLVRLRRALLVYSVYEQARSHAEEWTGVPGRGNDAKP